MKYLKLFENHTEYEAFKQTDGFIKPNVSHCIQENEVHYTVPIDWGKEYFTIESLEDNNKIYLKAPNTSITKTVSAATDNGETWVEYTSSTGGSGTTLATLNRGDRLLIKGENSAYATSSNQNQFKSTKQFEVKGNIMSLISGDSFANADELTASYTFYRLFEQCDKLKSAENLILPATTLTESCYRNMFKGCTSLTTAPALPTTTLAQSCCASMFNDCTSLTSAPELPSTTLENYCYRDMFNGCTSLTTAPALPATTLAQACYGGMFWGCTSLTTAPALPTTTLANYCYNSMFRDCTSLTSAPELPATTLTEWCYEDMFNGCTNLTTAPQLPATTLASNCYNGMFRDCTSLTEVSIVPNSVKPVSSAYCCSMYQNCNVQRSSDYDSVAYDGCGGGSSD